MVSFLSTTTVCLIACHGGPADHFAAFAADLNQRGYVVQLYATGPALEKLQERRVTVSPFSLDAVDQLATQCSLAHVIITDVAHTFDVQLHKTLVDRDVKALKLAYYDNPEAYVPGGYSEVAAQVMEVADGVLFANARLADQPIYREAGHEILLKPDQRTALGYYPLDQAQKIAARRVEEKNLMRAQFFARYSIPDQGQKILVYAGGNNTAYFDQAFPAFLRLVTQAAQQKDLSSWIVLLQQHPGARIQNKDGELMQKWLEQQDQTVPYLCLSSFSSDEAQVMADGILYYQTSMGPQFALAGIPTIQVGHHVYEDILVRNHLCAVATDTRSLLDAMTAVMNQPLGVTEERIIQEGLGVYPDWADRLERVILWSVL